VSADSPAISSDGTNYLVVWQQAYDILGTRVSFDGKPLDNPMLSIDRSPYKEQQPALAYGGSGVFLAVNQGTLFYAPRTVAELVSLGNTLPTNHAPTAVISISPLFSILPNDTNLYILSYDGVSADILFDASQSHDSDNQSLHYIWYVDGQTNLAHTGISYTNVLSAGVHTLKLVVSDGHAEGTAELTFEIISSSQAMEQLVLFVNDTDTVASSRRPLLASLTAALASFESGKTAAAINQLHAFENKVGAQVAPFDPKLASQYTAAATLLARAVSQ